MQISKEGKLALKFYTLLVLCIILLALTVGCATFNKIVTNNELTMQLATEAATARVIHDHPGWKARVISITEDAMFLVDAKKLVELGSVESYVKSKIAWHNMLPEEQAIISVLITRVRMNLEDTFRANAVTDPGLQMVEVYKVLGWINASALRQPGAVGASLIPL